MLLKDLKQTLMNFRISTDDDIPGIVELLKISLGESLMPKSIAYWSWKHIENPFGSSPVMVATEGQQLIGVRAFMNWRWENEGKVLSAIRAVDTATHPDYQGKGIFKGLTLKLLERCREQGVDFVFNTPNQQSKPGYLKMGWVEAGKMPVTMSIKRPLALMKNKLNTSALVDFLELPNCSGFSLSSLLAEIPDRMLESHDMAVWQTPKTKKFLEWRYIRIPVVKYYGHSNGNSIVIFRLKRTTYGIELRVVETIGKKPAIESALLHLFFNLSFDYMTIDNIVSFKLPGILKYSAKIGPLVTVRALCLEDMSAFVGFHHWMPRFGDMEVF